MDLTMREEYRIKFCMKLIAVISPNNYYSQFYHPSCDFFHYSGNFSLFQVELIRLWILERNITPPA
jgi:hypothetical protein